MKVLKAEGQMNKLIQVTNLYKVYHPGKENEVRAVNGISLTIAEGEFVAILGSSGSGKSTLMNLLGCLDTPTYGEYYLDGEKVSEMSDSALSLIRNKKIGFVFQGYNLIPALNSLENVELPLMYRGIKKAKRRSLSIEALKRVGLSDRITHRPSEMSGGQQQRVAIARAIAAYPPVIMADEPTGNLDSKSGEIIMNIFDELSASGRTIILITHDTEVAKRAGRIIKMLDGRIESDLRREEAV